MPPASQRFRLQTSHLRLRGTPRGGFSFVEVLFAVMILGIGFIMIAGVFPVAISQTAQTQEETIAATCARGGVATVSNMPGLLQVVPASGEVTRLTDDPSPIWTWIKGNQILPQDQRYGWIPLLKRNQADSSGRVPSVAQLIIIPVQVRARSNYDATDLAQNGSGEGAYANLMAWPIEVRLNEGGNAADTVTISSSANPTFANVAAPGAVIVIRAGATAGRIYRLGNQTGTNTFELLRGSDMNVDPSVTQSGGPFKAFIVGQGMSQPGNLSTIGNGNMATGAYSTFINLK
jgi:hypothetical protein